MAAQVTRKLNQVGPSSLGVVIPKPFVDFYKLHATDPVLVIYGSLILIVPAGAEEKFREREEVIKGLLE
jgi:hypothetical protein